MKPIKLIISAFGPYAEEMPPIEFEQFEEKGLFLICGDTGAGKTTIFDAICFALYGSSSGSYRDSKNLRSEYAKESTESYVDFYFSHQGHEYRIYRQPEYMRKKLRGQGMKKSDAKAILYKDGQPLDEKKSTVNRRLEELLHINEMQFKQIAMIAQGEFWKLLNASTDDRTKILRKIFRTEGYQKMEFLLKEHMDESYKGIKKHEDSILQYFRDLAIDEAHAEYEAYQEMRKRAEDAKSVWNVDELLAMIFSILEEDEKTQNLAEKELAEEEKEEKSRAEQLTNAKINNDLLTKAKKLEEEKTELETKQAGIDQKRKGLALQKKVVRILLPLYREQEELKEELASIRKKLEEKKQSLSRAKEDKKEKENLLKKAEEELPKAAFLEKKADRIAEEEVQYKKKDSLQTGLIHLQTEAAELKQKQEELKQKETERKERIEKDRSFLDKTAGKPEELRALQAREEKQRALLARLQKLSQDRLKKQAEKKKNLLALQKSYLQRREVYEKLVLKRLEGEKILENCRAGILAELLEEEKPCPVCGSTHHPNPAALPDQSISEEAYKKLQQEEKEAEKKKNEIYTKAEAEEASLREMERSILEEAEDCLKSNLLSHDFLYEKLEKEELGLEKPEPKESELKVLGTEKISLERLRIEGLPALLAEAEHALFHILEEEEGQEKSLLEACRNRDETEKRLNLALNEEASSLQEKKDELEKESLEKQKELTESQTLLAAIGQLSFESWKKAAEEEKKIRQEAAGLRETYALAEKAKNLAEREIASLSASAATLEKSLSEKAEEKEKKEKLYRERIREEGFDGEENFLCYAADEKTLAAQEKEISEYDQLLALNKARLEEAKRETEGKVWMDLETLLTRSEEQKSLVKKKREKLFELTGRIGQNKSAHEKIAGQRDAYDRFGHKYQLYRRLYGLVKGTSGNGKITLEQYIQAAGFDSIIRAANRRLLPMSDGQFELYRRQDAVSKQSNCFLDLEVLDHYTGHRRPVNNLSGGESFKASLSLALGLSDTVSSNLGGLQMDALFIDEGFGTLDQKSIENALEILLNLSEANKLVGIISHREELIEAIPQQIRVEKSRKGSQFQIELT